MRLLETKAGAPYDLCKAALQHFKTTSPVRYALRPSVRLALEAGAADEQKVRRDANAATVT